MEVKTLFFIKQIFNLRKIKILITDNVGSDQNFKLT